MKYDPMSDEELAKIEEENLLQAGIYDFEVSTAKDTFSTKGNDMTALELKVLDNDGRERKVFDYLVAVKAFAFKIKHFAYAVGLEARYQGGELIAEDMIGRTGKCKIIIQPAKDQYRAKNAVADYVTSKEANGAMAAASVTAVRASQEPFDDQVPF